ncbi:hypothetical protein LNQ49_12780 [Flavobacterium sp. F-65]|uniref:Uncharacterized protein n=1 Tax=Flavobacterium pisciphilum TaxID=2893755 RepID=A0ABS8MUI5_9FLAO|nr:hypothetical protein [Flavobacterium sp. F-65]MCC9072458.1 hypothetical protein [Flavobacterium sp. F-65]
MSIETFKQAAAKLFASTTHQILWANVENPNQEFFTSENTGRLSLKKDEKLTKFERPEEKVIIEASTSEKKELNANDTITKIKAATSLEDIKEFENDERKSVKSVYGWKVNQLTAGTTSAVTGNGNKDTDNQK